MKHKMQHPDAPTWCVYCGTFDHNCEPEEECDAQDSVEKWNSETNFGEMFSHIFGKPLPEADTSL